MKKLLILILFLFILPLPLWAQGILSLVQLGADIDSINATIAPSSQPSSESEENVSDAAKQPTYSINEPDEENYTLGPNDSVLISLQGHPELSGEYTLNSEGTIQYEFVGDVAIGGLTKRAVEKKIKEVTAQYVVNPKPLIKITAYKSKSVYVIGQVMNPGKYYMSAETIPVREAIIAAGMPRPGSAQHRARLITPGKNNEAVVKIVDLNALLLKGDLEQNPDMHSGDQLYVPTTQEEIDYIQAQNMNNPAANEPEADPEEVRYTLGPDDVIKVTIQGHPEVSGTFSVNLEGKIQMEMVGDIDVNGLTKKELADKIANLIKNYVNNPSISVTITDYKSKAIFVIGQVSSPGKFYIRSEKIPVREAIVEAGFPIPGSAMHRARLIHTGKDKNLEVQIVDLNALLYKGDMTNNFDMHSGDQLYVPTTQEEMDYIQTANSNDPALKEAQEPPPGTEDVLYKLGPDDVVKVTVQAHPEISGTYSVNLEGKIQMEMVGDVYVTGLTKKELGEKIGKLVSSYVDKPDISVTIMEYKSKVYYVIGEVGQPGKYYMRSESITVRDAVVEAGLPTVAAAMRKCRLITPAKNGETVTKDVDLYSVLYGGKLDGDLAMRPGDFLYVPATVMAKVIRVIAPVSEPVTSAAAAQTGVGAITGAPLPKQPR